MEPELINSLPAEQFLRNQQYRDFTIGLGMLHGEDSSMFYLNPDGTRYSFPLRPVYHAHDYYELIYVMDGVLTQHLEQSTSRLSAGDAILLNNQIRHKEGLETNCSCIYLQLSPAFLQELLYTNPTHPNEDQHQSRLFRQFCPPDSSIGQSFTGMALEFRRTLQSRSLLADTELPDAQRLLDAITMEITKNEWGYAFLVQGMLLKLFAALESSDEYHASFIQTHADTDDILYASILHYLQEQHGRVSRTELTEVLHYHPDYLNRVVKRHSGLSFKQMGQKYCIEYIQTQLRETDDSIEEILQALNYTNKSHFYQLFREMTGMTPQEYRKQQQKQTPSR